jgi:ribosomal-protein-alanine N-acetyltransferase
MPDTRAAEHVDTARLVLRRPIADDVDGIFEYASDLDVTRYVGFPRHLSLDQTRGFLAWSDEHWAKWPAGPMVVELRGSGDIIGASGLTFDTPRCAQTGYVFAKRVWGRGYATETLGAMVQLARECGVVRLYANCHHRHRASAHVLEKGGFMLEGLLRRYAEFPNLGSDTLEDVLGYSIILENLSRTEGKMRS